MSVVTTADSQDYTLEETLANYDLHHSDVNANTEIGSAATERHVMPICTTLNPPGWDTSHRRVPTYRPVRPENFTDERNTTQNNVERAVINVMFGGVQMQSVSITAGMQDVADQKFLACVDGESLVASNWTKDHRTFLVQA